MILQNCLGCLFFLSCALFFGHINNPNNYFKILKDKWKLIALGIGLLFLNIIVFTYSKNVIHIISLISQGLNRLKDASMEGTKFVFGYMGGGDLPFEMTPGGSAFVFAFQTLPTIIVVSVISAILTYIGALKWLARIFGKVFSAIFKISDSLGMVAILKVFLGQLEAPIVIKSQLEYLSKLEITIMISLAFSTSSAAVIPMYASILEPILPNAMNYFVISNILNVVATVFICRIILPNEEQTSILPEEKFMTVRPYKNTADAVARGLADGAYAWWSIVGSLVGMVALVYVVNLIIGLIPNIAGEPLTIQRIFAAVMYPFAWMCGVDTKDTVEFARLLGTKFSVNETVAFFELAKTSMEPKSIIQSIYALNNFGNLACVGITVNGMLSMAPKQRYVTEQIGQAFIIGTLSSFLVTTLMGLFI